MRNDKSSQEEFATVKRAFSKLAEYYDRDDLSNQILTDWRKQVYSHIDLFIKKNSRMLELNAGTGIDALHFVREGHAVHATDISEGMIKRIQEKIDHFNHKESFTCQQCSFEELNLIKKNKFDYAFSNFGGLNCCSDLSRVTKHLPDLLNEGAFVTWVIMPPVYVWEVLRIFKGKKSALRRFNRAGVLAHIEGEYFKTYYYSLTMLKNKFGKNFRFLKAEGLGALSPPPASINFTKKYPGVYSILKKLDQLVRNSFPFNRWADHIIVTFQFTSHETESH